ncbi:MAG: ferredoxin [Desulfurococcales archaeon]|nr:ferredoxin [Desulfurococcales archaeon]
MVKYKVIVDRSACISCGTAPTVCPQVFVLGEDNGKNRVTDDYVIKNTESTSIGIVPENMYECVKRAADSCPVLAIKIEPIE